MNYLALILLFYFLIQIFLVNTDPKFYLSFGRVIDQGFWLHNIKNFFFWKKFILDKLNFSYLTAPLFNFSLTPLVLLFGKIFLAAKLLSLFSSIILILVLNKFLKIYESKKTRLFIYLAILTNYLFAQHARLALPEMFSILLLLPSFLLLLRNSKKSYFFAGLFFALSFLTKGTNAQLTPAFVFFFFIDFWQRKKIMPSLFFSLGSFLILITYFSYLFSRNLLTDYLAVMQGMKTVFYPKTFSEAYSLLLNFPEGGFWNVAGNFFLIITPLIYFMQTFFQSLMRKKNLFERIEILMYCWIFGAGLTYTLAHFQSLSRLISLIIPLAFLNLHVLEKIDLKKLWQTFEKKHQKISILMAFLLQIPISIIFLKALVFSTKRLNVFLFSSNQLLFLFILFLINTFILIKIKFFSRKIVIYFASWFALIFILPSLTFYIFIKQFFDYRFLSITAQYVLRRPGGVISFLIIFLFFIFIIYNKRLQNIFLKSFIFLYFLINLFFISNEIFNPQFTFYKAKKTLENKIRSENKSIAGGTVALLALDKKIKFINFAPQEDPFYGLQSSSNEDFLNIDYYVHAKVFDGKKYDNPPPDFVLLNFEKDSEYFLLRKPFSFKKEEYQGVLELWKRKL